VVDAATAGVEGFRLPVDRQIVPAVIHRDTAGCPLDRVAHVLFALAGRVGELALEPGKLLSLGGKCSFQFGAKGVRPLVVIHIPLGGFLPPKRIESRACRIQLATDLLRSPARIRDLFESCAIAKTVTGSTGITCGTSNSTTFVGREFFGVAQILIGPPFQRHQPIDFVPSFLELRGLNFGLAQAFELLS
jgi:hypothetical protein